VPAAPFAAFEKHHRTGLPEIDSQHADLFEVVNRLHRAALSGEPRPSVEKILASLRACTIFHFDTEEKWMKESWFPDYVAHKAAHDELTNQIIALEGDYADGTESLSVPFIETLRDWLIIHVTEDDVKLADHLRRMGF
jgi:hemerythrin-like metal-binding protein